MLSQSSTLRRGSAGSALEAAREIAVNGLLELTQDPETIGRFMSQTGVDPGDLRSLVESPEFLAAVLEFMCSQEPLLLAFCANHKLNPETVDSARKTLAGPEPEWGP